MLLALVVFVHCARSYVYREALEEVDVDEGISFRTSMAPSACAFASFGASLHSRCSLCFLQTVCWKMNVLLYLDCVWCLS